MHAGKNILEVQKKTGVERIEISQGPPWPRVLITGPTQARLQP